MHDDFFRLGDLGSANRQRWTRGDTGGYRWSDDLWISVRGDWMALYRPLNLGLMYLRRRYFEDLQSLMATAASGGFAVPRQLPVNERKTAGDSAHLSARLAGEKFIIPQTEDVDSIEHNSLVEKARSGSFRFICILPTTACSLQCTYCHQRPGKGEGKTLRRAEIVRGLKKCARLCAATSEPVDILIYGGEPLSAFHLTEEILKLTSARGKLFEQKVRLSLTTSGYGLGEREANILAQHDVFVIVSVDGPPEVNDRVRRVGDGSSAFAVAERAYRKLKSRGCRMGLSVTMGTHNLHEFPQHIEFLLDRFQPNDIGLNAFLHRRSAAKNPYQMNGEAAFQALVAGFDVSRRYGVYAEQPFRRLRPFVFRQPLLKDCSAPGERLVLAPGGLLGFCDSCYPDSRFFYPIDEFPGAENRDYRLWAGLSAVQMPHCRQCPAMTVCGGACRYDAYRVSGRWDGVDPERCKFERAFLNWMIWSLFDALNIGTFQYYWPRDEERRALLGNVSMGAESQPFTAGSYSK